MPRRIFRKGNSAAMSLPADAMEAIGLGLANDVVVAADPEKCHIIITPATPLPGVRAECPEGVDRFTDR